MIKRKNAILKIGILCIIFFFTLSAVVLGDKVNLSTVKIQFSNGSEINIFTTKNKISDILADANIVLLETETVSPNLEENLDESKKITISNVNDTVELSNEETIEDNQVNEPVKEEIEEPTNNEIDYKIPIIIVSSLIGIALIIILVKVLKK